VFRIPTTSLATSHLPPNSFPTLHRNAEHLSLRAQTVPYSHYHLLLKSPQRSHHATFFENKNTAVSGINRSFEHLKPYGEHRTAPTRPAFLRVIDTHSSSPAAKCVAHRPQPQVSKSEHDLFSNISGVLSFAVHEIQKRDFK
jgi:hypothetical protein